VDILKHRREVTSDGGIMVALFAFALKMLSLLIRPLIAMKDILLVIRLTDCEPNEN